MVYLSTKNLSIPKGREKKLVPKYIGPYKIVGANMETSSYTLELPPDLVEQRIHLTFHVDLLQKHELNDDILFPHCDSPMFYNMGNGGKQKWLVDEIVGHCWVGIKVEFYVRWTHGGTTWEPYPECNKLSVTDEYFHLQSIQHWRSLPRKSED